MFHEGWRRLTTVPPVRVRDVLDIGFAISSPHFVPFFEGYISASLDLAHEYMRIGKTRRTTSIFNQALDAVRGGKVSDEISALFLLRFAESLALLENVPRRWVLKHLACEVIFNDVFSQLFSILRGDGCLSTDRL